MLNQVVLFLHLKVSQHIYQKATVCTSCVFMLNAALLSTHIWSIPLGSVSMLAKWHLTTRLHHTTLHSTAADCGAVVQALRWHIFTKFTFCFTRAGLCLKEAGKQCGCTKLAVSLSVQVQSCDIDFSVHQSVFCQLKIQSVLEAKRFCFFSFGTFVAMRRNKQHVPDSS